MNERERTRKKRFSLRAKNTLIFVGVFVFLIGLLWILNSVYLPKYYLQKQLGHLEDGRVFLEELIRNPQDESIRMKLTKHCESCGISAIIAQDDSPEGPLILFTSGDDRGLWRVMNPSRASVEPPHTIYKQTDTYTVSLLKDPLTRTDRVECRGSVEENGQTYVFLLSLPMAKIAESVSISNRFLLLLGAIVLLLGAVLFFLVSQYITKPVVALDRLSQKMADLDFSERFEGHSGDEIQTLGENINHLSDTLETTIDDLKKANLALERDVREKEEENRRRKELLSNISHELKTPIALIQGYAEGLRDGMCEGEETRIRYSDTIIDEAGRMNWLVQQLLSLDEMESGQMEAEKSVFNLTELIRGMTETFRLQDSDKGIRWELDLPEELSVESDEMLVEQIMQNYLSNACHYVEEGGLIQVSAFPEGRGARIDVFNQGDLIPEEALNQIWNKFYKVDKARTRSYGGSGIGLSVVKAATDLLGGSCSVENRENGVCFTVHI